MHRFYTTGDTTMHPDRHLKNTRCCVSIPNKNITLTGYGPRYKLNFPHYKEKNVLHAFCFLSSSHKAIDWVGGERVMMRFDISVLGVSRSCSPPWSCVVRKYTHLQQPSGYLLWNHDGKLGSSGKFHLAMIWYCFIDHIARKRWSSGGRAHDTPRIQRCWDRGTPHLNNECSFRYNNVLSSWVVKIQIV